MLHLHALLLQLIATAALLAFAAYCLQTEHRRLFGAVRRAVHEHTDYAGATKQQDDSAHKADARVLYLVTTGPANLQRAMAIRRTWGSRVSPGSRVAFFSHEADPCAPAVLCVKCQEYPEQYGLKELHMLQWTIDNRLHERYDFVVKVDDDAYMIPSVLERYLADNYDADEVAYLGRRYAFHGDHSYVFPAGGPGIVVSRGLLRLVERDPPGIGGFTGCDRRMAYAAGDFAVGTCLLKWYGLTMLDSRDPMRRERFSPIDAGYGAAETNGSGWWLGEYTWYTKNGWKQGDESTSSEAVAFHYMPPEQMWRLDFVLYELRPLFRQTPLYALLHRLYGEQRLLSAFGAASAWLPAYQFVMDSLLAHVIIERWPHSLNLHRGFLETVKVAGVPQALLTRMPELADGERWLPRVPPAPAACQVNVTCTGIMTPHSLCDTPTPLVLDAIRGTWKHSHARVSLLVDLWMRRLKLPEDHIGTRWWETRK